MSAGRFLRLWLAAVVGLSALAALTNIVVDPYDVFGWPRRAGLNAVKPAIANHVRIGKIHQIARFRPVTIVIGTSRPYVGFDAMDPAWPETWRPVYNAGWPGSKLHGFAEMLASAVRTGGVRHAVVLLDFESFAAPEAPPPPDNHIWSDSARDTVLSVFSAQALQDSLVTLAAQWQASPGDIRPDGTARDTDFARWVHNDGYKGLFEAKLPSVERQAAKAEAALRQEHFAPQNIDQLSKILTLCRDHDIALTLVFSPTHRQHQDVYAAHGLQPAIEQWKQAVVALVAAHGKHSARVFDFYGPLPPNLEPVPTNRSGTMRYWWEPVHFTKALGHLMIRRIADDPGADYGADVTPDPTRGN